MAARPSAQKKIRKPASRATRVAVKKPAEKPKLAQKTRARKPSPKKAPALETRRHVRKPPFRFVESLWIPAVATSVMGLAGVLWIMQKPLEPPSSVVIAIQRAQPADVIPVQRAPASEASKPEPIKPAAESKRAPHALDLLFQSMSAPTVEERVVKWSEFLWREEGAQAQLEKLGPPPRIEDTAPVLPRRYDCTTFVETVAALARSGMPEDFFGNLLSIRYKDGKATFVSRNHFPEADWIPNNAKAGFIKDVTAEIATAAGVQSRTEAKKVHRDRWLAQQLRSGRVSRSIASAVEKTWSAPIEAKVDYIPYEQAAKVLEKAASGTILNFVRDNDPASPVLITHQGFIVREKGVLMLRHVSHGGNVRTVVLRDYLAKQARQQEPRNGKLVGINLNRLMGT